MKKKAMLFKKLTDKKIMCIACNHYCTPDNGKTGKCGIRQNIDGELFLLTYGNAIGLHVDPVEKKPLYHLLPGKNTLSFGTAGCNFSCLFCQNREMSQMKIKEDKIDILKDNGNPFFGNEIISPKYIVDYCINNFIPAISYTYNEPTVFFEYAYETMKLAKENGIKNIFVSNGFMSKEVREMLVENGLLDAINIDIKSFSEDFYKNICVGRLQPVLDNIKYFYENNVWIELTTLIIPDMNDSDKELTEIAKFIYNVSPYIHWHVSAFHQNYKMIDKINTPIQTLKNAYEIGKRIGLKYIYIGNIYNNGYESTCCPKCKEILIDRVGSPINIYFSYPGICKKCGEKIIGRRN